MGSPDFDKNRISETGGATQSRSFRIFFRARFRANACLTLRFSPGFR
jgi:hypothetical protein